MRHVSRTTRLLWLVCLLFSTGVVLASVLLTSVSQLRWSNRVVVIDASSDTELLIEQLQSANAGIESRHMLWFVLNDGAISTNYTGELAQEFESNTRRVLDLDRAETVLIGKDGGVKARENSLDIDALFRLIDTMPMRQREMREQELAAD